jgi:hypothetical protein
MEDQYKPASQPDETSDAKVPRPSLLSWLWPVPVGIVIGVPLLASFVKGPSQLTVGGGVGGGVGLLVAFVLRALLGRRTSRCT